MKTLGIIVEYNPFHNGHLYHLQKSKEFTNADYVIAIMSGNYVERGEPACIDKFARAKMAISEGVDIVIELPTFFSSSSAEFFAYGGVKILDSINIITDICFGAETDNLNLLSHISDIIVKEPADFTKNLKNALSEGNSYPRARNIALSKHFSTHISTSDFDEIINSSNNILGIEYLKALKKLESNITPHLIKRHHVEHNSGNIIDNMSSATNIRKIAKAGNYEILKKVIPQKAYEIFIQEINKNNGLRELNDFSDILQYKLKTMSLNELTSIWGMNEGIENRLIKCTNNNYYITDILAQLKTKRYTYTTLERLILHTILGIDKSSMKSFIDSNCYARVLGFRKESENLLKLLKENSKIPIITNINDYIKKNEEATNLYKELMWTDIYNLINHNKDLRYSGQELMQKMIVM